MSVAPRRTNQLTNFVILSTISIVLVSQIYETSRQRTSSLKNLVSFDYPSELCKINKVLMELPP